MEHSDAALSLKFLGEMSDGGKIDLRDLAKALTYLQSMIDRAHIGVTRAGVIKKYSRLYKEQYGELQFYVGDPVRNSFLLDFVASSPLGRKVVSVLGEAIAPVYSFVDKVVDNEIDQIETDVSAWRKRLDDGDVKLVEYSEELFVERGEFINSFSDRSILKYLDCLVAPLRSEDRDSELHLEVNGARSLRFEFNRKRSRRFHRLVSRRTLGAPYWFEGEFTKADKDNLLGDFRKASNGKRCKVYFNTKDDVIEISKLMGEKTVRIKGAPILEYGSYDPGSGDIQYLGLVSVG